MWRVDISAFLSQSPYNSDDIKMSSVWVLVYIFSLSSSRLLTGSFFRHEACVCLCPGVCVCQHVSERPALSVAGNRDRLLTQRWVVQVCDCVFVCMCQCWAASLIKLCVYVCGTLMSLCVSVCVTESPQRWKWCVCWWERWRLLSMSHPVRQHLWACVCVCMWERVEVGGGCHCQPSYIHSHSSPKAASVSRNTQTHTLQRLQKIV